MAEEQMCGVCVLNEIMLRLQQLADTQILTSANTDDQYMRGVGVGLHTAADIIQLKIIELKKDT